ncbi:MAG: galactose-1-phosphate uridylyltransferase [Pyrinomonadaceae bacterium MAG19_C2-C3]|nr:galactose-1-phosphate uridylyltransferase [Pyrinomonadaceae bacterium MAG19_C2-C3]
MSELRWNPLMGEWVATATERQERTFLPPADFCPLCPTKPGGFPTEIPEAAYDIVVFENRFPSLRSHPPAPAVEGTELYPVRPAQGVCEVVVYSSRHTSTLADESIEQIHQLVQVWTHRFRELDALDFVHYVFMFENKGEAIGVTLHHPHGQIYAYPFIPPRVEHELKQCAEHTARTGRNLILDILEQERTDGRRIIAENNSFTAFIPFFARYPFETYIIARRPLVLAPTDFTPQEARDLAEILKQVLVAFDNLFNVKFPYMMVLHGRPSDKSGEADYSHYQFHIEFYPPLRTATKLKYLAGSESGAGLFINDTLAEVKAAELRSHISPVVWQANASE